jgi:O-antigen/teichoic acid export membrane protein
MARLSGSALSAIRRLRALIAEPRTLAFVDQCIVSCSNFLVMLIIGRRLPAAEFGFFTLAMLAILFVSNLHRALLTQPLNVLGPRDSETTLGSRLAVLLGAHAVVVPVSIVIVVALSIKFFPQGHLVLGACIYLTFFFLQETLRRYWYTVERLRLAVLSDLISYGGQMVVLAIAGLYFTIDGEGSFLIMAAASLVATVVSLRLAGPLRFGARATARTIVVEHWQMSRWLLLTVFALWGSSQLYPFLIASLGPASIALFAVSRNLLNVMNVVVQSVLNYLPTRATALLRQQGEGEFRRHLARTLVLTGLGSVVFVLAMQVLAYPVLHVLYRGAYDAAVPVLRMLSAGMAFSLAGAVLGSYSLAMHDSRSTFLANLGSSVFTFTGGLWLIHAHGIYGAAIAACLSLAVAAALQGGFVMVRLNRLAKHEPARHAGTSTQATPVVQGKS